MKIERPHLLLVEDNPADAHLVSEALSEVHLDCELSLARDGAQAIEFIERLDSDPSLAPPDLVLLDLNLPKVNGEEVLKHVKASAACRTSKVLIMSSSDAPADKQRAIDLGATDYFRKPSSLDQFMELGFRIQEILAKHQ